MKGALKILLPLMIFIGLSGPVKAQEGAYYEPESEYAGWHVALMTGFSQFYGDVSQNGFFTKLNGESKLSWSLMIGKEISPLVTLRGQVLGGNLVSYQDNFDDGRPANLFLDTRYFELGANARFNLNTLWMDDFNAKRWEVYGVAGLSFATWDALLKDNITSAEIDPLADRTHSGLVIPIGIGFEYNIYNNWHLFTEWTYRFVASEKVDLVEGGFSSDPILNVGFGVNYKFGVSDEEDSFADEDEIQSQETTQYRRLNFEGPDILEFSPENACTNVTDRKSGMDNSSENLQNNDQQGVENMPSEGSKRREKDDDRYPGYESSGNNAGFLGQGLTFSVQILAVSKPADIQSWERRYNIQRQVMEYDRGGLYRYIAGDFNSYRAAEDYARILKNRGISDAFVVVFRDGEKVRLTPEMKKY